MRRYLSNGAYLGAIIAYFDVGLLHKNILASDHERSISETEGLLDFSIFRAIVHRLHKFKGFEFTRCSLSGGHATLGFVFVNHSFRRYMTNFVYDRVLMMVYV